MSRFVKLLETQNQLQQMAPPLTSYTPRLLPDKSLIMLWMTDWQSALIPTNRT